MLFKMNETIKERGFTKENIKRLTSWDSSDWFWVILFILLIFSAYGYYHMKTECQYIVDNSCDICQTQLWNEMVRDNEEVFPKSNQTNFTFNHTFEGSSGG